MSDEKILTKEIAEQVVGIEYSVLGEFTAIEDAAAEVLSKCNRHLYLEGLKSLSDVAAESLSKHEGVLYLSGLTSLSDVTAENLSKHEHLDFNFDNLPESAARILRDAGHG